MKVLMVEPGKIPYEAELIDDIKSMQETVGGLIEGFYPYDDPVAIVCNEEGKINGLPLNRAIYGEDGQMIDIIAGNFFVAGIGGDSFTDLPENLMDKYMKMFYSPEKFIRVNGEIIVEKMPFEAQEQTRSVSELRTATETQSVTPQRLFVDMDGVLAEFNPIAKIEELYEQGYFANLKPQQNVVDAVKLLCNDPQFEVYILSSVLDSPYALDEKNQWLDAHLPEIDKAHRLFPAYGDAKIWIIPDGLKPTDTLLDDYSLNLNAWCPPGQAIKMMNGINGNHGTWQGARVSHMDSPEQIADAVKSCMEAQQAETLADAESVFNEQTIEVTMG